MPHLRECIEFFEVARGNVVDNVVQPGCADRRQQRVLVPAKVKARAAQLLGACVASYGGRRELRGMSTLPCMRSPCRSTAASAELLGGVAQMRDGQARAQCRWGSGLRI